MGAMDKQDARLREYLYERAELLGAIRLPNTAFKQNANTEVTTDMIFLRRLYDGESPCRHDWWELASHENAKGVPHRLIWDLFLQMLDAARITLADHRTYDLSGFYISCTSNIGSQQLLRPTRLPFATLERAVLSELHRVFRPELIGRFDEKIVFKPLSPDTQREIGLLAIHEELARFRQQGFALSVSEPAFEFLVRRGIHKTLGTRPMKRTAQKLIGDAIRHVLKSRRLPVGTLDVSLGSDVLTIEQ